MWNRQREAEAAREKLRETGEDTVESAQPNRNPPPVPDELLAEDAPRLPGTFVPDAAE